MAVGARALRRDPVFLAGLALKLALVALAVPQVRARWFVPFLQGTLAHPSLDPWSAHLAAAGDPLAFPYGPVMYLAFLPGAGLGTLLDRALGTAFLAHVGFGLTVLAADVAILLLLPRLVGRPGRHVLWLYWLSPIVLYVSYWHGQIDIVPVALLVLALVYLRGRQPRRTGLVLGAAAAAKLSMLLAAPLFAISLWRNSRLRHMAAPFVLVFAATVLVLQGVAFLSPGARAMVFGSPELRKVYSVAIPVGESLRFYVLPIAYVALVYRAWTLRRMSDELAFSFFGVAFFLVLLLTPASVGWYLWLVPFLIGYQVFSGRAAVLLVGGYSVLLVGYHLATNTGAAVPALGLDASLPLASRWGGLSPHMEALWLSANTAVGLILAMRMYHEGVHRNDFYRLSRRPLSIGIAGDSGVGKDTLAAALTDMFGRGSTTVLSGDDYHIWDRYGPMWRSMTHLNPRANYLAEFADHALALIDGRAVRSRHYDHQTGRFAVDVHVPQNDVIIVSGLHALQLPLLRERYEVSIYLDMDEDLRRFLKVRRDVGERGHPLERVLESIERRAADARQYVHPQAADADVVFTLAPVNRRQLADASAGSVPRLKLTALLRRNFYYERIVRALVGISAVHIDVNILGGGSAVELTFEGDTDCEDVALAARRLVPHMEELLALNPRWRDGALGLMQLITVVQSAQVLQRRL